ncbi:MAG: HEPN domain-containing protein [Phycisphaerales bacterium]
MSAAAGGATPPDYPVAEWISKAQGDLDVARREAAYENHNPDVIAFLCQQSVEKLMKAALVSRGVQPPRVHDLPELLRRLNAAGLDGHGPSPTCARSPWARCTPGIPGSTSRARPPRSCSC